MKTGANIQDVNRIVEMAEAGKTASNISKVLQIDIKCVRSFVPKKVKRDAK